MQVRARMINGKVRIADTRLIALSDILPLLSSVHINFWHTISTTIRGNFGVAKLNITSNRQPHSLVSWVVKDQVKEDLSHDNRIVIMTSEKPGEEDDSQHTDRTFDISSQTKHSRDFGDNTSHSNTPKKNRSKSMFKSLEKYQGLVSYRPSALEAERTRDIGEQVRSLRTSVGYSRIRLSELLDVDLELITSIELGIGSLQVAEELLEKVKRQFSMRP